ncbi:hypothetical protein ACH5RR_028413 [Cinchona calisaya]|uniref:Late blight resistance protein R1A-like N-terminal domain-containing protein n=1 Tax=Cinchona calisaya TaxID=153742 RepID=A0ABD2YT61_9GENT
MYMLKRNNALPAQIEALEDKLTFFKSFIRFAKLFCIEGRELEHLFTHIQVVALIAARLSYICLFYKEDEEVLDPNMCSMMSELLQIQKINPVVLQVYETCINVLTVSKFSASKMDKLIVSDFNDSLIGCLWLLLLFNTMFKVSEKGQMKILYEGLRFFRSILREPQEQTDELDGRFLTVLIGAGIVICSLYVVNNVNEVDVNDSVVRDSPDYCSMLVNINNDIKLIKAQITGSSMMGNLPSNQILEGQVVTKTCSLMPSKGKITTIHEVIVELKDEEEEVTDRLIGGSENLEIIPIVGMPGLGMPVPHSKLQVVLIMPNLECDSSVNLESCGWNPWTSWSG